MYHITVVVFSAGLPQGFPGSQIVPFAGKGDHHRISGFFHDRIIDGLRRALVKRRFIEPEKIHRFAADFENYARQYLNDNDIVAKLNIDAETKLSLFTKQTVSELQLLAPFGQGNPRPLFATKGVSLSSPPRRVGAKGDHLQLVITDNMASVRCIGFGFGKLEKKLLEHEFFNIAFQPQINNYNGNTNVEFILADIQFE